MANEMDKYFFTFGCGQPNAGTCQPILAKTYGDARAEMFRRHGDRWAFQYTEAEWNAAKEHAETRPWVRLETELPVIAVDYEGVELSD